MERESVCNVHGCTRTVKIDKDSQLRAWAAMRTDDVDAEPVLPKKMCDVCREFYARAAQPNLYSSPHPIAIPAVAKRSSSRLGRAADIGLANRLMHCKFMVK